jgi:hypothetical protein
MLDGHDGHAVDAKQAKEKFGSRPKRSGHQNEVLVAAALNTDKKFRARFCERVGIDESLFAEASADGKNAKLEESVLGGKTAGKTDVAVRWKDGRVTNVSIKKRAAGQVYLVTARNFVAAYEAQYREAVPEKVKRALALFIGEAPDSKALLDATDVSVDGKAVRQLAREQSFRLMFDVISSHDPDMAAGLLRWLREHVVRVFELCFSAGAVKDRAKWAHVLWYRNLVDEERRGLDFMVSIRRVMEALARGGGGTVDRGPKNAGSTILLPFGHLQYHLGQLEFYQQMAKIQDILRGACA